MEIHYWSLLYIIMRIRLEISINVEGSYLFQNML